MGLGGFWRKARQLFDDPTLRYWLLGRLAGKWKPVEVPTRTTPPYLAGVVQLSADPLVTNIESADVQKPNFPMKLNLPGGQCQLTPGHANLPFDASHKDTETLLALHRFSWCADVDPSWTYELWQEWCDLYGNNDDLWAWQPYTTAERLIYLTRCIHRYGMPKNRDQTLEVLGKHGQKIFSKLEYYGEKYTGNHLANNGRGLYLGGLLWDRRDWYEVGKKILIEESKRIFSQSGTLKEGSVHYHFLVWSWYEECWQDALSSKLMESKELKKIANNAAKAAQYLCLPGGIPLIGDVSPDCPPSVLYDKLNFGEATEKKVKSAKFIADGWLRAGNQKWDGLWHADPAGWSSLPGHGHRDYGSFELHYGSTPVLVDLGRRSYEAIGDQDLSSKGHNMLMVDDVEPYPPNKPYYTQKFRDSVGGSHRVIYQLPRGVEVEHDGFSRLTDVGTHRRTWAFNGQEVAITDFIDGSGTHKIEIFFHTQLPVKYDQKNIKLGEFTLCADGEIDLKSAKMWREYGRGEPATRVIISKRVKLPNTSTITIVADNDSM